jgi:ADP-ribosyl-[dinitrogen reductase] hydrolase
MGPSSWVQLRQDGRMWEDRAVGVVVGAAVGDALGAPYEFGPSGALSRSGAEMQGGGSCGWEPGEWTDDTQMGLHITASLLARGGLDEGDIFDRFKAWAASGPADIGIQTSRVLGSDRPWQSAATADFELGHQAAGNGSLMRTFPAAVYFASAGAAATADAARRISALTHGDPAAGETCVVLHELVRRGLTGEDPRDCVAAALELVLPQHRSRLKSWLDPGWTPGGQNNGVCWVTLAQAIWAVRTSQTFAAALRRVVDLGGDTDTVACVTGALAGATWGMQAIPSSWTSVVHGRVPGDPRPVARDLPTLQETGIRLAHRTPAPLEPLGAPLSLVQVAPRLVATNLAGARKATGYAVVSLCRGFDHPTRQIWLIDKTDPVVNPALGLVVADTITEIERLRAEGQDVLVHCHAGQSRTALIVRAWLQQIEGLTYEDARLKAEALRPQFHPNDTFEQFLRDLPPTEPGEPDPWTPLVAANGQLDLRTTVPMPERDYPECREEWMRWAAQYNGYELLGPDLTTILRPCIDAYQRDGRVPDWCGDHLLRGWLFWHYRCLNWDHEHLDPAYGRGEWQAIVDSLRARMHRRRESGSGASHP